MRYITSDPTAVRKESPLRKKSLEELANLETYWRFTLANMQNNLLVKPETKKVIALQIKKLENLRYEMAYLVPPDKA